jgi:hypothetical protein
MASRGLPVTVVASYAKEARFVASKWWRIFDYDALTGSGYGTTTAMPTRISNAKPSIPSNNAASNFFSVVDDDTKAATIFIS